MTQTPGSDNASSAVPAPSAPDFLPPELSNQGGAVGYSACSAQSLTWCRWQFSVLSDARALVLFQCNADSHSDALCMPIAAWPETTPSKSLRPLAVKALSQQQCLSGRLTGKDGQGDGICLAIPLPSTDPQFVALVVSGATTTETQQATRQLVEWGSHWLLENSSGLAQQGNRAAAHSLAQTVALHESVQAGCEELVARIADYLKSECVSIGFYSKQKVTCRAMSDAPKFDARMALVSAIENAMEESLEQQCSVGSTLNESAPARCHEHLRSATGGLECYTVPLIFKDQPLGAITVIGLVDRVTADGIVWLEQVAKATAPVLNLQLLEDRTLAQRVRGRLLSSWQEFTGREHTGRQLVAMLALVFFLLSVAIPGTHRVAANASIEGSDRLVISAPTAGFVLEASARAGDTVTEGDVIARLDDRELLVKQRQWQAELDKLEKSYSQALAESNRTELSLLRAQRAEFNAELDLIKQQLERNVIKAPFSGVLVSGDLSQQLGAPVQAGEALFEVTSLNSWRLIVDVDEHAVADIETGQSGFLRLASMPDHSYAMTVTEIMPVALSQGGKTVFRLEATIAERDERLRPGMRGVAKIDVGQSPYLWLWTHRFVKRVRIWLWSLGL